MPLTRLESLRGAFLAGACGDALGAPVETKALATILKTRGPKGVTTMRQFRNAYGTGVDYPKGRLTDDTTMLMSTAAALLQAQLPPGPDFSGETRPLFWQAYLNWGAAQADGPHLAAKIDPVLPWPDLAKDFWFACGAGRGTIAALSQDAPGSLFRPQEYDMMVRGRRTQGPNAGCGGMMRIAPVAFLPFTPAEIFEAATDNAALTHGDPSARVATGAAALLVHFSAQGLETPDAVAQTRAVLSAHAVQPEYAAGIPPCLAAIDLACRRAAEAPLSFARIDALPAEMGHPNPFLAVPVLAQVVYALHAPTLRDAITLAATQSGDSDSVAAIVGNVMGARTGESALPRKWLSALIQREAVEKMAEALDKKLPPPAP